MLKIFKNKKNYGAFIKTQHGFDPLDDKVARLSVNDISIQ